MCRLGKTLIGIVAVGVIALLVSVLADGRVDASDGRSLSAVVVLLAGLSLSRLRDVQAIERARQNGYDEGYDDGRAAVESAGGGSLLAFRRTTQKLG